MTETRKRIRGYENYEVSDQGNVYNTKTDKKLALVENNNGYKTVSLSKNGIVKTHAVHKLVLYTFNPIENAEKFQVMHKDGNYANNNLDNLCYGNPTDKRKLRPIPRDLKKLENMLIDSIRNTITQYTKETGAETMSIDPLAPITKHIEYR